MNIGNCESEKEVLRVLTDGRWPHGCAPELRDHVHTCRICSDAILVRSAFQAAAVHARAAAPIQTSSLLWQRAQLRRRFAAIEAVNRPLVGANRFALTVNLLAVLALLISLARRAGGIATVFAAITRSALFHPYASWSAATLPLTWSLAVLIPCAALTALLSGVVIYVALDKP